MNSIVLEQLREYCRNDEAFEQLKRLLPTLCVLPSEATSAALFRIVAKTQEDPNLNAVFDRAVTEVQQVLQVDRVAIFRFQSQTSAGSGEFVAEAVLPDCHSLLATRVYDRCFVEQYTIDLLEGQIQTAADIHSAGLQAEQIEALISFQVRAYLRVPLWHDWRLWGLLCLHQCSAPRQWQPAEIQFAQQVAALLNLAIRQSELLIHSQQQAMQLAQAHQQLQNRQGWLVQSERMVRLGQLAAGITQEINNPVNFIYGNLARASHHARNLLDLLVYYQKEHSQPSPELEERLTQADFDLLLKELPKMLGAMQIGADRIRQMVQSLRNFSRLDAAERQPVHLHEGIDSTLLVLQHRFAASPHSPGIQVLKEYSNLPLVECYAGQLNQVFLNLLLNAIEALEAKAQSIEPGSRPVAAWQPQITIRTLVVADPQSGIPRAVICIADNGPGISAHIQPRLLTPFFTTKPVGIGLGLTISQEIVERHGGVLNCYSRPEQGTEFWVEIPVRQSGAVDGSHLDQER